MTWLLPALLALMMFTMGLSTHLEDFRRVLSIPKLIAIGALCQLLLLPVLGYLIASSIPMSVEMKIGFMVICLCPGGILSNFVAYQAKGSVPLSVSLTVISSIVTVFSIPALLPVVQSLFGADSSTITLPFAQTLWTLAKMTIAPLALGLLLNHYWPAIAAQTRKVTNPVSSIGLVCYILYLWFVQRGSILAAFQETGLAVLLLVCAAAACSFLLTRALNLDARYRRTIMIETCIQNSALAFTVTVVLMKAPAMSIPTVFYTVAMFMPALVLVVLGRRADNTR